MKVQILGTAAAEGWPALFCNCEACRKARALGGRNVRTRAGTMIDDQLLIDFSADTYGNALRFGLDLSRVHTLLVTHDHEDHLYAEDLGTRYTWFAHLDAQAPETLWVYGNDRVGAQVARGTFPYGGPNGRVAFRRIVPFRTEEAPGGHRFTALMALHDRSQQCYLYLVEDAAGKAFLYGHDTGLFPQETMDFLAGRHLDLVTLDCTDGPNAEGTNHMGFPDDREMQRRLQEIGCVDERTKMVLTHFSH
ncbi:MAG: MBL fold metallo-hydrolase, partial [Candidatus Spyradocola sp.]